MYHAVLGTFPMATFTKWQLPKYAISKMYFKVANQLGYLALRLGQTWEIAHLELSCHLGKYPWENVTLEKFLWEVVAWENTLGKLSLGKIHLGSCLLENTLEKLSLEKMPLEVVAWENTFGKFILGKYLWKVVVQENTLGALGTCKYLG